VPLRAPRIAIRATGCGHKVPWLGLGLGERRGYVITTWVDQPQSR
jgi:hypothetical protein